jgi:hypothetical protein
MGVRKSAHNTGHKGHEMSTVSERKTVVSCRTIHSLTPSPLTAGLRTPYPSAVFSPRPAPCSQAAFSWFSCV